MDPSKIARPTAPQLSPTLFRKTTWCFLFALCTIALPSHAREAQDPAVAQPKAAQESADGAANFKKMSLAELMEIEITSVSKRPEKLSESPSAIQVITGEDLRRSGAPSIPEALRLADNLAVAQKNAHDWAISARGFNTDLANKMLVLIDGRSVYTPLFSGVFWNEQDTLLEDVERIEVISGPGSTLWGANAVNGVINVISKSAADTHGGYLEAGGGEPLQKFFGGRYGGALKPDVHMRGYAKYFERGAEVLPDGRDASDSWRKGQGGFRLDAGAMSKDLVTVQGDVYVGRENLSTSTQKSHFGGGNLLGRWSHTFSDVSSTSLQMYYDRTHLTQPVAALVANGNTLAPAGILKDDLHTYDLDFQHRLSPGKRNRVIWGLGYRFTHDVVFNAPALAFSPPTLDRSLFSAFAQDEITLSSRAALTVGSKVEHNSYTGAELEPSAKLRFNITSRHVLWAAASRAVRMPSRVDRDERVPTPALAPLLQNLLTGGPNFASETVISYELGFRAQAASKLSASFATFYNRYDQLRSTSNSPPPALLGFPLFYENNLEGETRGIELTLDYQARDWWRLHAGAALLHEDIRVAPGKTDLNKALNETADPGTRFSLRSSMNLARAVQLDFGFRFVDSFHYNNGGTPGTVPSYQELDAHLLWHATKKIDLSIIGRSLLHDQHLEYVISGANPREEMQRGVFGRLTLRW